jgi:serine/threonine protein kinase
VLGDELVAVKKLYSFHAIKDEPFQREVDCLMRIRHCNIVWFVGYCAETSTNVVRKGRENMFVDSKEKLLCFEYLRNGSLRSHLDTGITICDPFAPFMMFILSKNIYIVEKVIENH